MESPMNAPIATYEFRRWLHHATVQLHEQHIAYRYYFCWFRKSNVTISLVALSPTKHRSSLRHPAFWVGLCFAAIGSIGWILCVVALGIHRSAWIAQRFEGSFITGTLMALLTFKHVECIGFAGNPPLYLWRGWFSRKRFEQFVDRVVTQITKVNETVSGQGNRGQE